MSKLDQKILTLKNSFNQELNQVSNQDQLENLRVKFLGRSGQIALLMQEIKDLSLDEKRIMGPKLNEFKAWVEELFEQKKEEILKAQIYLEEKQKSQFDVTAYNPNQVYGSLHPYTYMTEKIENIFLSMGYEIVDGPEIEEDYYNFEALNIPSDHPARDMQDTFWLGLPNKLLRTQTSAVQIRAMEKKRPPLAILATGKVYRHEATDASHDFVFVQVEALLVGKNISLSNLLATIKVMFQSIFEKEDLDIRVRTSYFPFVEPGIEVDMSCPFCIAGCSTCKGTRWIEMGGAGLVHPNVLKSVGIDSQEYSGFALGFGLTRLIMLKYGINDIRLLNSGKLDFLEQFRH